jgi:hypothetical protein
MLRGNDSGVFCPIWGQELNRGQELNISEERFKRSLSRFRTKNKRKIGLAQQFWS